MARLLGRKAFVQKDMTEMRAAIGAFDFNAHAVRVRQALYGAGHFVIEGRPTAMSVKLVFGTIKLGAAAAADVGALLEEVVVLACERRLSTLELDYVSLLGR